MTLLTRLMMMPRRLLEVRSPSRLLPAPNPKANVTDSDGALRRAAAYVRKSTEHQQYSIENQLQAIADYASSYGIEVVRIYTDAARSGLSLQGRDGLRQLIADVWEGRSDFTL